MFELSDFYTQCREREIDIIPYTGCPSPGATIRDGNNYAIFLDFAQILSTRVLRGVCAHELGHAATGALHKVSSRFETVERSEYRAQRWAAENFLTEADFRAAFAAGCTQLWELAEYFDLPEKDVAAAYTYWTDRRQIDFNN